MTKENRNAKLEEAEEAWSKTSKKNFLHLCKNLCSKKYVLRSSNEIIVKAIVNEH